MNVAWNVLGSLWSAVCIYVPARIFVFAVRRRITTRRQQRADVERVRALGRQYDDDLMALADASAEAMDVALWELEFAPTGEEA